MIDAQTNGAGPPANVAPADLWTKLTTTPRPSKEVPYPRRDPVTQEPIGRLSIQVLTEAELMSCRAAADEFAKEILKNPQRSGEANIGYGDIYRNESVIQVLVRACFRTDLPGRPPAFPNAALARKYMTSDELTVLFQAYCDFQSESGPILSSMTTEEMNAWLERLAEGAAEVPLAALSSDGKNRLLVHSALLLRQLQMANGSVGQPPGESSSSTNPKTNPNEDSASSKPKPSSPSSESPPSDDPQMAGDG